MKAEIISIGTELLLGQITDTNASYLASQLPLLGIDLYFVSQVGDNQGRIVDTLRRAWGRSELILTTGGLGPTEDDVTRESIAQLLGEEMGINPTLEKELRGFFASRGWKMPERNIKQATLIPSARAISNPRGTAPGWWVEKEGHIIISMPGPPSEMQRMWEKEVYPRLKERLVKGVILSRTLKLLGVSEAGVDEQASPWLKSPNPTLATYAKADGIQLRITAKAEDEASARQLIAPVERRLREVFGEKVWGRDGETLEGKVGALLQERKLTLASMESCSGGLLASAITDNPGSSAYFKGGLVAYTNEAKIALGVEPDLIESHGAMSPEVALAMAHAARRLLKADIGLGVTGVAGPSPLEGKQPGLAFIGIASESRERLHKGNYPPRRPDVKRRAALDALWQLLLFLQAKE